MVYCAKKRFLGGTRMELTEEVKALLLNTAKELTIRLAYYPPYHSKYNPIERCWGILEQHWNGTLLDSLEAVIQYATSMTWKGKHPVVSLVTAAYQTGVTLSKEAMDALETQFQRFPLLRKWFVDINSPLPAIRDG